MTIKQNFEFIIKLIIFSLTFYYTIEYIFKSEIHNTIGFSILCIIIILISIFFYLLKK